MEIGASARCCICFSCSADASSPLRPHRAQQSRASSRTTLPLPLRQRTQEVKAPERPPLFATDGEGHDEQTPLPPRQRQRMILHVFFSCFAWVFSKHERACLHVREVVLRSLSKFCHQPPLQPFPVFSSAPPLACLEPRLGSNAACPTSTVFQYSPLSKCTNVTTG